MKELKTFIESISINSQSKLIESLLEGYSAIFESTASIKLKEKIQKYPFYAVLAKQIKKDLITSLTKYNEKSYEDQYSALLENLDKKPIANFINTLILCVITEFEEHDAVEQFMEEYAGLKQKIQENSFFDPNQQELFGDDPAQRAKSATEHLKQQAVKQIVDIYNSIGTVGTDGYYESMIEKMERLYDPLDSYHHDGSITFDDSDSYEMFNEELYHNGFPGNEPSQVITSFIYGLLSDPDVSNKMNSKNIDTIREVNDFIQDWANDVTGEAVELSNKAVLMERYEDDIREVVPVSDTMTWYDLGRPSCGAEGKKMGHCGNTYGQDKEEGDELWSLRSTETGEMDSHMTVVINSRISPNGERVIKQIKGNGPKTGNAKPSPKYHTAILKLLTEKDPDTDKYIVDGFKTEDYYGNDRNFHLTDLDVQTQAKLKQIRPELFEEY